MNSQLRATRQGARRIVTAAGLVLALLVLTVVIAPQPADAWYRSAASRRPGAVVIHPPMAIDSYDGYVRYLEWRTAKGPLVYRSPSTRGPQVVQGVYTVQEWTPSFGWTNTTTQTTALYRIPAGVRSVRLPALDRAPQTTRGYFRVRFAFAWVNARTAAPLGATVVLPNLASDHQCITLFRPCETGSGWIRTGRLSTHGGGW